MSDNPYDHRFPLWMPDPDHVQSYSVELADLPPMCPVSQNPRPGSRLTLHIPTNGRVPEVAAVVGCAMDAAAELVGGHGDIRSMEAAVAHIARRVADLLGTVVRVDADLRIAPPGQPVDVAMRFTVEAPIRY